MSSSDGRQRRVLEVMADCWVRRRMRTLFEREPHAFRRIIADLQRCGASWEDGLPPRASNNAIDRESLAYWLAHSLEAKAAGLKQEAFRQELVDRKALSGNTHYDLKPWKNVNTIRTQLRIGRALLASDPEFAKEVEYWRDFVRDMYIAIYGPYPARSRRQANALGAGEPHPGDSPQFVLAEDSE